MKPLVGRESLDGSLGPPRRVEDLPGDGDAEFPLNVTPRFLLTHGKKSHG
jgi:hypothetical protein